MLPRLFADAAGARDRPPGFDGVELHFAHAYTMASFLSALNTRDDGYGGPREQRVRLPLEVVAAVRERVAGRGVVGCRYLGDDVIEGGNRVDDAAWFGVELARAGLDFLSISKGGKFEDAKQPKVGWASYPYTGQSGYECMPTIYSDARGPFARNVALAATIRAAVRGAGLRDADRHRRRHLRVRAGRGRARARRGGPRRVGAPDARRSRLVREDARRAAAARSGAASSRTTARRSTSSTSRSPASCGIATRSTRPTSRSRPTASAGSSRRAGAADRDGWTWCWSPCGSVWHRRGSTRSRASSPRPLPLFLAPPSSCLTVVHPICADRLVEPRFFALFSMSFAPGRRCLLVVFPLLPLMTLLTNRGHMRITCPRVTR